MLKKDLQVNYLAPGFIDLQIYGSGGKARLPVHLQLKLLSNWKMTC
jgi:N-acetylglucosamine-6-phosphate deacetylase